MNDMLAARAYAQCACATQANGCGPCGTLDPTTSAFHVPATGWFTCITSTLFVASNVRFRSVSAECGVDVGGESERGGDDGQGRVRVAGGGKD